ncbi:MAG: binding--dependent transport system inner rane component family protein [Xanthobacteraceae bacterium]|nr:binding--dependent transport system inner rane component family protein [Xanthobacteraceae bacterium]
MTSVAETVPGRASTSVHERRPGIRHRIDPWQLLVLPASAYLLLAFAAPLAVMFAESFHAGGGLSLANYDRVLMDSRGLQATANTVRYASWVTFGCVLLGVPTAMAMVRASSRTQMIVLIGMLLPMSSSIVVKSFGWMILFRRTGLINETLMWLGVVSAPVALLFTEHGLIIATISLKLPLMVLPVFAVLSQIPGQLGDAATTLGAGPVYRFRRVTLPLALPGIAVGFAIVFSQTAASYLIPTLLAGGRYPTLSKSIVESYIVSNAALGSAFSVVLLVTVGVVVWLSGRLGKDHQSAR